VDVIVELYQRYGRNLATATSALLVMVISLAAANGVLFVIEHWDDRLVAVVTQAPLPSTQLNGGPGIDALNLFGNVAQSNVANIVTDAPETRLNLELQGVFIASAATDSSAIVAERNKTGELFRIGDRLPGNAILDAVFNDHILLKRGGRVEKLMFTDSAIRQQFSSVDDTAQVDLSLSENTPVGNPPSRLQQVRERIAERQRKAMNTPVQPGTSLRSFVDEYRDRIKDDPAGLLNEIGISSVSEGEANGYRLGDKLSSAQMQQAGLQQGDLVLSVNGTPVGNAKSDAGLIDQAMNDGRVRVEIQRADRRFFLTVPIPKE
jgi:general secretion pathway protein C